ncbi:MAG: hypothetical protein IKQ31_02220 [Clostridia bacterium]|nr:hypothetical protein [Clostridia bacterium]
MRNVFNLTTKIKNRIKIRHTKELSLLLSVSVLTGLYNINDCIDIGLKYYERAECGYPVKIGERGLEILIANKETCQIIDICNQVCEIFDVEHNLKNTTQEFEQSFYQMYQMAVVTKHLQDFPVKREPCIIMQK